uniref:PiggyBac transposable element-derived protein domain-containing protein n=1 Tax=Astyanax mexicanus TaxID=7994 RepID=A0A3B1JJ30_ASTMX
CGFVFLTISVTAAVIETKCPKFHPRRPPGPQLLPGMTFCCPNSCGQRKQVWRGFSCSWKETEVDSCFYGEFYVVIALTLYMDLVKVKNIMDFWCKKQLYRFPFLSTVMSSNRCVAISSNLHLSDPQEDEEKRNSGLRQTVQNKAKLYTDVLSACQNFFSSPGENCPLMSVWRLPKPEAVYDDSASRYTWNFLFIKEKSAFASGKGLSYDSFQTLLDYSLLEDFFIPATTWTILFTACGTIHTNRQGFPCTKINDLPKRAKKGSIRWFRQGKLLYVKWMDTREVTKCSTIHKAYKGDTVSRRVKDKQGMLSTTSHMGGVDLSDVLIGCYNVLPKSRKCFILYQQLADINGQASLTQKAFREALVVELTNMKRSEDVAGPSEQTTKEDDPTPTAGPPKQPAQGEAYMTASFAADATEGRKKCENCKKEGQKTKAICGVLLCLLFQAVA